MRDKGIRDRIRQRVAAGTMLESSSNQHDRGKSRFGDEVVARRHEYE